MGWFNDFSKGFARGLGPDFKKDTMDALKKMPLEIAKGAAKEIAQSQATMIIGDRLAERSEDGIVVKRGMKPEKAYFVAGAGVHVGTNVVSRIFSSIKKKRGDRDRN